MKLKGNNTGMSLIELIIAVAMMSILVVPIVFQLISSINQNTRSRERQNITEASDYVLEYFQKENKTQLDKCDSSDPGIVINSMNHKIVTCALYDSSFSDLGIAVTYDVFDYELNDTTVGVKKANYKRTASIDNLANKVMSEKRQIDFNADESDASSNGFYFTQDGKCVQYDSDGHINALVVETAEKTGNYVEPGKADSGYIQDLDSDKIAVIESGVNSIDKQFATDVLATCIKNVAVNKDSFIKKNGEAAWDDLTKYLMDNGDDSTVLNTKLKNILRSSKRYIEINLKTETAGSKYHVTCVVYYTANIKPIFDNNGNQLVPASVSNYTYKVYDKVFNTSESPDVYYVYEPLKDTTLTQQSYVPDDYIIVHADEGACGYSLESLMNAAGLDKAGLATYALDNAIESMTEADIEAYLDGSKEIPANWVEKLKAKLIDDGKINETKMNAKGGSLSDPSKIYLIKPDTTSMLAATTENTYYYYAGGTYENHPVRVHINQEIDNGGVYNHMLDIYTNIYTTSTSKKVGSKQYEEGDFRSNYWTLALDGTKDTYVEGTLEQFKYEDKMFASATESSAVGIGGTATKFSPYLRNRIHPLAKTTNFVDTLYTVTVKLTEDTADSPKSYAFVAGKGAN